MRAERPSSGGVPSGGEPGPPTLSHVLAVVGGDALDVVHAPRGLAVPVRGVALYDAGEHAWDSAGPGAASTAGPHGAHGLLLLAVGVDVASAAAPDVLLAADRIGAAGVVMRRGALAPGSALLATARRVGTALLARGPGTDWTELLALLRAGVSYADQVGRDGPDTADAPGGLDQVRLGDLPALANVLADLVGGAITIEDTRSRVLAYSRTDSGADPLRQLTILGQRVPEWRVAQLRESGFFRELWTSYDVVHLPAGGGFAERLAIAVRVGDEVLGSLWAAAANGRELADDARAALRAAARAAVPHLIQHRAHSRLSARRHEEALLGVLTGRVAPSDREPALGLDDARRYAVVAVDAPAGPDAMVGGGAWQRLLDVLALQAAALRTPAADGQVLSAQSGSRMYVVVPVEDERPQGPLALARELAATARTVPPGAVLVGVGRAGSGVAGLPESRASADLVLRVLAARGGGAASSPVAEYGEVIVQATLLQLLDRVEPVWRTTEGGPVHRLVAHDAEHGTAFRATLSAYLAAFGDVATAAAALTVHPNTLRYRLRRIRELFDLDLGDPAARLLADVGLRLADRESEGRP
jgi:hypothetical protein